VEKSKMGGFKLAIHVCPFPDNIPTHFYEILTCNVCFQGQA